VSLTVLDQCLRVTSPDLLSSYSPKSATFHKLKGGTRLFLPFSVPSKDDTPAMSFPLEPKKELADQFSVVHSIAAELRGQRTFCSFFFFVLTLV
jgi:hypothetical protein